MKNDQLMIQLRDVCKINPKKSEIKNKDMEISFVPMAQLNEHNAYFKPKQTRIIKEVYNNYTYFKDNDVLLAKITPCFENGKAGIAKNLRNAIGFGSTEFIVLRSSCNILPKFIYYLIANNFFRKKGINNMTGTVGQKRVPVKFVEQYKIPLVPLPEQKAIVKKIENLFKLIDKSRKELETAKEELKVYRQAVLKKAFEGKLLSKKELETCRKEKNWKPASQLLKDINPKATFTPSEIRNDWIIIQLGDVCKTASGGTPLRNKKEYYKNGKIPWLKSGEVNQGIIYSSEEFITESGLKNSSAKKFPKNTILIAMYGATAGKVGLLKFKSTTNQAICGILPINLFLSEFLYMYLRNKTNHMINLSSGGAQPNISQKIIKKIKIPLAPLPEQKTIVQKIENIFSHCDKIENVIEQNLKNIDSLKQSILKKAFSGNFLSKKDLEVCRKSLNWKPAKELLKEIQKEKRKAEIEQKNFKKKGKLYE